MTDVQIVDGYIPGAIGRITELHATYYQREAGFGLFFEARVATELAAFLEDYDADRDSFFVALCSGKIEGSIAIDGSGAATKGAHLRWFIVSDDLRGHGLGQKLIEKAIAFCRSRGFERIYLWTFEGLDTARHVCEKNGFELVEQQTGNHWGRQVNEQRYELRLT
jgi:GNAT superfamily N-acetyltransferase